jgi:thymidylate synthase
MNNIDKQYKDLLQSILNYGVEKKDRTGTGTKSIFGYTIRHNMKDGFPLLTTKKMSWKTMVTELLWFLRGDTNIKYLVDNNCHIWDGDAYKNYSKLFTDDFHGPRYTQERFIELIKSDNAFAKDFGDLGPIYGKQWRSWRVGKGIETSLPHPYGGNVYESFSMYIDQIANLINDLKTNPDSRRLMVNAWNVGELDQMVLPPCHYGFQVYTRELSMSEKELWYKNNNVNPNSPWYPTFPTRAISLMWNQRSVDTFLGLPFNIASYGLLLEIIAKEVNMVPDELIGNLGDVHLYNNHIEQAKEQIGRDYTLEERLNMVSEEIQNEFSSGIVNLPNFPNTPVWSDDGKMSCLDDFGVPRRTREPYPLPTLNIFEPAIGKKISILDNLHIWSPNCFIIENYQSHPTIKAPLSN